jgi:hypothetical protein
MTRRESLMRARIGKKGKRAVAVLTLVVCVMSVPGFAGAQTPTINPGQARDAASASSLKSLATVGTPKVSNLGDFLNAGAAAQRAAMQLGKAFFWDMQTGSDGQACGSCHFHAGKSPPARRVDRAIRSFIVIISARLRRSAG